MINIAGLTPVDDPSYRYKMPRIVPKIEGRGNGIKTVLVNVVDLGTSLNREPSEITKFFGFELGAQTTFSPEEDNRAVVNGAHTAQDLQNLIAKYIELFVLCKACKLPETYYKVKHEIIYQKCLACGSKDSCDMTHKLTTFILKHVAKEKEKDKESKKDKKKDKEKKKSDDADDEEAKEKKKKDKEKKKKEKKAKEDADSPEEDETDRDATEIAIEQYKTWNLLNPDPSVQAILSELRNIQTIASLRPSDRIVIFMGAKFTELAITENQLQKYKDVLSGLAASDIQQRQLIAASEWFCGTRYPELLRRFPVLLKQLYDEDLVEEEVFYSWATDYARNEYCVDQTLITIEALDSLRAAARPFINWLQEAQVEGEEEEEDDEEDDDDVKVGESS